MRSIQADVEENGSRKIATDAVASSHDTAYHEKWMDLANEWNMDG